MVFYRIDDKFFLSRCCFTVQYLLYLIDQKLYCKKSERWRITCQSLFFSASAIISSFSLITERNSYSSSHIKRFQLFFALNQFDSLQLQSKKKKTFQWIINQHPNIRLFWLTISSNKFPICANFLLSFLLIFLKFKIDTF